MSNFVEPIKVAFGRYLQRFHQELIADTPAMAEYAGREFAKSAVWAPGRMVDQVMDMLESWRKNDTSREARATPFLPIMIAAMSKDFTPAPPDFSRPAADPVWVTIPGDAKKRTFKMRAVVAEVRTQIAICAAEEATAKSIGLQLAAYCMAIGNRRFYSTYRLAGTNQPWPVVFEVPDIMSIATPNDQKNLTVLAADFNLRATVPMLMYPKAGGLDADGQGSGTYDDPDGYLVVQQADIEAFGDIDPDPDNIPSGAGISWTVGGFDEE